MSGRCLVKLALLIALSSACERARDPEAKPLRERDGLGRPEPGKALSSCDGAPTGGPIRERLTLKRGCILHVEKTIIIDGGAAVTVEPGVRLLFAKGAALKIAHGTLEARGEKGAEIVFGSDAVAPAEKDWNGIELVRSDGDGSAFDHVVIEHAGGGTKPASLLVHSGAHVTLGTCTVRKDGGAGIRLET